MALDETLNEKVRAALAGASSLSEVKMFGGIGFMLHGNMVVAASDRGLLLRVGPGGQAEALARPGAAPMVMRGKAMPGYVRIAPDRLDARTIKWGVGLARAFVENLAPKKATARATARAAARRSPRR